MQDLKRTCRSAQITQHLAGADPTSHILTINLPSASVSTTILWRRVIKCECEPGLQSCTRMGRWERGVTSWVFPPGVRLSGTPVVARHGLPNSRPKSREYPLCDGLSRPRLPNG